MELDEPSNEKRNTKKFAMDQELNELLMENFFEYKKNEKIKKGVRSRVISFNNPSQNLPSIYWDDRFYKGFLNFGEFKEICEEIIRLSINIKSDNKDIKSFRFSKWVLRVSTYMVVAVVLLIVIGMLFFSSQITMIIYGSVVLGLLAAVITFINSIYVFLHTPADIYEKSKYLDVLFQYISNLNEQFRASRLLFKFNIQVMSLEIIKLMSDEKLEEEFEMSKLNEKDNLKRKSKRMSFYN